MNDTAPGNAATLVMLAEIVRDPALQCRAALDAVTVVRYAEVIDKLPPVRCIRVRTAAHSSGWQVYLVDGWHRFAAHEKAGRDTIHAFVEDGDRRAAILEAVKANSSHGLPRSHEDARRAVRVLLMDAEWCKLSDRKLAALADVSHTHVAGMRKRYGVKAGEVLDQGHALKVDGELSPEWREVLKGLPEYSKKEAELILAARTPEALSKLFPDNWSGLPPVFDLRAGELAEGMWPWSEDMTQEEVDARFAAADTVEDLLTMAGSMSLTPGQRRQAYQVVKWAADIEKSSSYLQHFRENFKGRQKLEARLAERIAEQEAAYASRPKQPHEVASAIHRELNVLNQSGLIDKATDAAIQNIRAHELQDAVREGAYKARVLAGALGRPVPAATLAECVVPDCDGWILPSKELWGRKCAKCGLTPGDWTRRKKEALTSVAELLVHPGYGFVVEGVVIDHRVIEAIKAIRDNRSGTVKLTGELGKAVRSIVVQTPPSALCVDPSKDEPEDEEEEEDEDLDSEEGDEDADE